MNRINYWIYNYMPKWEAASKEVYSLTNTLSDEGYSVTLNNIWAKKKKLPDYDHRVKTWRAIPFLAMVYSGMRFDKQGGIDHLFASPAEPFLLKFFKSSKSALLTVTKDAPVLAKWEKNLEALKCLAHIVVESPRHKELLLQAGIPSEKLSLIYPGFSPANCDATPIQDTPFKILFATSPMGRFDFLSRGIYLMLQAAKELDGVEWHLIWREENVDELKALIKSMGLEQKIIVHNGFIKDMDSHYESAHAVILPGLGHHSLKPCPHSGVEGFRFKCPLLVSSCTSLAEVVRKTGSGIIFEPTISDLVHAIRQLIENYQQYTENTVNCLKAYFDQEYFLREYTKIYKRVLESAST